MRVLFRYAPVGATLVLGIALTVLAFRAQQQRRDAEAHEQFAEQALNLRADLQREISSSIEVVESIAAFYEASETVSRDEFRAFVTPALERRPAIVALTWNPIVKASDVPAYRLAAAVDGIDDFRITEQNADGSLVAAAARDEYVPVFFGEPAAVSRLALGYDVASEPVRARALSAARLSGAPRATDTIRLVQDDGDRSALLIFAPVYGQGAATGDSAPVRGFVVGVFRVDGIVSVALAGASYGDVEFSLFGNPESGPRAPFYGAAPAPSSEAVDLTIDVAGRRWTLVAAPAPGSGGVWLEWGLFAAGLLATAALGALVTAAIHRRTTTESLVAERTADLTQANAGLSDAITERNNIEAARSEVEHRLRLYLDHSPDVLYELREGVVTWVSANAEKASGYAPEAMIGRPSASIVHPDDLPSVAAYFAPQYEGPIECTVRIQHADGSWAWRELRGVRFRDERGVPGAILLSRDVDEQRRAQAALLDSEEKYRLIVEEARDLVYAHDLLGNLTEVNSAGLAMFGYTAAEVRGLNFTQIIDPAYLPLALQNMQRAFNGEEMLGNLEFLTRAKDGTTRWLEITSAPVRRDGEIVGFRGIARDVTGRKRAESEAREAEERNTLLHERQRIAQELHDSVAQYFFAIGLAANASLDGNGGEPEAVTRLSRIRELSTAGGDEIRRAISTLSVLPSERLEDAVRRLCEREQKDGAHDVIFACQGAIPELLSGQHELLTRAAREALYNARKHASASKLDVTLASHGGYLRLVVCDDGLGRADDIREKMAQELGYGLPQLVARFDASGGRVAIADHPGGGVEVSFVLPLTGVRDAA